MTESYTKSHIVRKQTRSDDLVGGYRARDGFTKFVIYELGLMDNVGPLYILRWDLQQRQIGAWNVGGTASSATIVEAQEIRENSSP